MLALFAEPNGAMFYLDIQEALPKYYVPSYDKYNPSFLMPKPGSLPPGPRRDVKTYKLVAISKPLGEPPIAFYDRELQW